MKKTLKTLHLASFNGNIGDNANHFGFYKYLHQNQEFHFDITELEIREFYWKQRFFNEDFVKLVNSYDLLIVGGGNYFELWVETSPTGTSIAIELELLQKIQTPILWNALGVDDGQGVTQKNIQKFQKFLDLLIERKDFISIRNDGAKDTLLQYIDKKYLQHIYHSVDAGFFVDIPDASPYYTTKHYIAINIATDMEEVRFKDITYKDFIEEWKNFTLEFLKKHETYEVVFVPHIFRDIDFINELLQILPDSIRRQKISIAPLLHGEKSFYEVMSIYKNAQVVLANRFHANVCSIGLGTPTIGLYNYKQIQALYKELNSQEFVNITQKGFSTVLLNNLTPLPYPLTKLKKVYTEYHLQIIQWLKDAK